MIVSHVLILARIVLVQSLGLHMLSEDVAFEEVRDLPQAISSMRMRRHPKHLIQLLEGFAFGLGEEQQYQHKADEIPHGVKRESALVRKSDFHARPGDGKNTVEEPCCRCCKGHAEGSDV